MNKKTLAAVVVAAVCLSVLSGVLLRVRRAQRGTVPSLPFTEASKPAVVETPTPATPSRPALVTRSPQEKLLTGAQTLAVKETPPDAEGIITRTRLVKADFKYPLLRVEERFDAKNDLVRRTVVVGDHVMVKVREGVSDAEFAALVQALGGAIRKKMYTPRMYLVSFENAQLDTVPDRVRDFRRQQRIELAEPDAVGSVVDTMPNDTNFGLLWGMHNTGQTIGGQVGVVDADIDAPAAWDITTGSSNIVVAVIDTGVDYNHPDLAANMWRNPGEIAGNGIDDDGNGFIDDVYGWDFGNDDNDPFDDHYHGTHCAGTIGGIGNNATGVAGVCWNVRIMAVKWILASGSGVASDATDSITYTTRMRARLTSNSWHVGVYSAAMEAAIAEAGASNILFVAAAANDGVDLEANPDYPPNFTNANMIVVAATDNRDQKASWSNYGLISVDLGAPGVNIWSCKPSNQYQYLSGTSMACPHVAGACALALAWKPSATADAIKQVILNGAEPIAALSNRCVTGARLNINNTLRMLDPNLTVTPAKTVQFTGLDGGAFSPLSNTFSAVNIGSNSLSWTAAKTAAWLDLSLTSGSLAPGETNIVAVSVNATANSLPVGMYSDTVTFSNTTSGISQPRQVTLLVVDSLSVTPATDFTSIGPAGGPFSPVSETYVLSNKASSARGWAVSKTATWVDLSATSGTLPAGATQEVAVSINSVANSLSAGVYLDTLTFSNTATGSALTRQVMLRAGAKDFTELFSANDNDLDNRTLTFSPDGAGNYYALCSAAAISFPVDPTGGTTLALGDDASQSVTLTSSKKVILYGTSYSSFYVGSNGYITFGAGDMAYVESLTDHFALPRISVLFDDLNPGIGGTISWKQLSDRAVVTYQNVPEYGTSNANSFQIEMFFTGIIRITCLNMAATDGLAGLSRGLGELPGFVETDLSAAGACLDGWTAYHDMSGVLDGNASNVTTGNSTSTAATLRDFNSGIYQNAQIKFARSAAWSSSTSGTPINKNPPAGSDAFNLFDGKIAVGSLTVTGQYFYYTAGTNWATLTFSNVETNKRYSAAFYSAARSTHAGSTTIYTLEDVTGSKQASSADATILDRRQVQFETGTNYSRGTVARWDNIAPASNNITLRITYGSGSYYHLPQAIYLRQLPTGTLSPLITVEPQDQTIIYGRTTNLSVTATGDGPLGYQWYQGVSGNTNTLLAGATNSNYTTPALTNTTKYWVRVNNSGGATDSRTATINISNYATWIAGYGLSGPDAGENADPDGDGIVNLLEYALNLDPVIGGATGLPVAGRDGDHLTLTYTRRTAPVDLTYTVEVTGDVAGGWTNTGVTEEVLADDGAFQTVKATDPATISGNTSRFIRLKVSRL